MGEFVLLIGIKFSIFVNRSTATGIIVALSDAGRSAVKSEPICVHGLQADSTGCKGPCLSCLGAFVLRQMSHLLQYFHISSSIFAQ